MFLKPLKPKRFNYIPRYSRSDGDKGEIKIKSITYSDYHSQNRPPYGYLIFFIIVMAVVFYLGGVPQRLTPPELTTQDIAGISQNFSEMEQDE